MDVQEETRVIGCKLIEIPIVSHHKLGFIIEGNSIEKWRYQKLVGKLIYLSHTRSDIAYAISIVSQFIYSLLESHMEAVWRILKYLKATSVKGNSHL